MNGKDGEVNGEVFESLDDIMSTDDISFETIKGWGGRPVRIGSLTAGQMITFLENNDVQAQRRRNGLMLITLSLVDKSGKRLVNPDDPEAVKDGIEKLKKKDSKTNGEIVQKVLALNGMTKKDAATIAAAALAKNDSSEVEPGASPTS